MEAKKTRLRTYGHLINNVIGCNNIVLDSMSNFNLKIETNFIKYCMGKGERGITLVEWGKVWGSVANLAALGCVRFCFLTFLTRKIWLFERTHKNA